MADITPIGSGPPGPVHHPNGVPPVAGDGDRIPETARPSDRVELSDRARLLDALNRLPEVRQALIEDARMRIAAGDYPGEEALNVAIERLLADLAEESAT